MTAGTSANRSTATVLADDLVEELAHCRDPQSAAAAALERAVPVRPAAANVVQESPAVAAPPPEDSLNAQVVDLTTGPADPDRRLAGPAAAAGDAVGPAVGPAVGSAGDLLPPEDAAPAADAPAAVSAPADAPGPGRRPRRRERRGPSLREQRRLRTRDAIVDAAAALFTERGFDHVSVMEIAQRAGVVEKTVFNHFPVKEGLVFEADPPMRRALVDAVRRRPAGESVAAAAGSFVVAAVSQLGSPGAAEGVAEMTRVIRGSRTLQVREKEILGTLTDTLAEQIALETRASAGELEPWLAANAVLGLYSALLELARERVLAGMSGPELVAELRTRGQRGLALLQFGLAGYAKRR